MPPHRNNKPNPRTNRLAIQLAIVIITLSLCVETAGTTLLICQSFTYPISLYAVRTFLFILPIPGEISVIMNSAEVAFFANRPHCITVFAQVYRLDSIFLFIISFIIFIIKSLFEPFQYPVYHVLFFPYNHQISLSHNFHRDRP